MPLRAIVLRLTTFNVSIKGVFKPQPDLYVIDPCAKVQLYNSNDHTVRKSASQLEMQGELFNVRGHLVVSLT